MPIPKDSTLVWGKRAERLAPYLEKGQRVYVEGETRTSSWEDDKGQKRYRTEVVLAPSGGELVLLGNGSRASQSEASSNS